MRGKYFLAVVKMSSLIVLSFATAMTNDEISITASHYACLPFYLLFLMVLLAACLPKINMLTTTLGIHLSKSESYVY